MKSEFRMKRTFASFLFLVVLTACGGSNDLLNPVIPIPAPLAPGEVSIPAVKYPIPKGLWSAPARSTPADGNYVFLQSDNGDLVGRGNSSTYTNANSSLSVSSNFQGIFVAVDGNLRWNGSFVLPTEAMNLQAGYFNNLTKTGLAGVSFGGLEWYGTDVGCSTLGGWIVIDRIIMNGSTMTGLDLRFEQSCNGASAVLHGQIHWNQADSERGFLKVPASIPADLWQPPVGATPQSISYVYLESGQGDFVGGGKTYLYTKENSILMAAAEAQYFGIGIQGDKMWTGSFAGLKGLSQLAVGYYAGLRRVPFNNPVLGGLTWYGDGRGCNKSIGWFAVDNVVYKGVDLDAIDLRFEQTCDGSLNPLRGKLHWTASDPTVPKGPENPPPPGLWTPPADFVAPNENYVYLEGDQGDYILGPRTLLLTANNAKITLSNTMMNAFRIDTGVWTGDFITMNTLTQVQPGYYGNVMRTTSYNPTRGGLDWNGDGRGCNALEGWFVVDRVTYSSNKITAIDLRFEQHCEGRPAALHGKVHWVK